MAYTKTTWNNGATPAINKTNLDKIEQGIYDAHEGAYEKALLTTKGDIVYASDDNTPSRLPLGSNGLPLISNGEIPVYGYPSPSGMQASNTTLLSALTERSCGDGTGGATAVVKITDNDGLQLYIKSDFNSGYTSYTTLSTDVSLTVKPEIGYNYIIVYITWNDTKPFTLAKAFRVKYSGSYRVVYDFKHEITGLFTAYIKNVYVKGDLWVSQSSDAVITD